MEDFYNFSHGCPFNNNGQCSGTNRECEEQDCVVSYWFDIIYKKLHEVLDTAKLTEELRQQLIKDGIIVE
jgi:hypothetical protein